MPATPERIAFITRDVVFDTRTDAALKAAHPGARDTGDQPRVSYFDDVADAAVLNAEAFALLAAPRRRFGVLVAELVAFSGGMSFAQAAPTVTLIDAEQAVDGAFITSRLVIDYEADTTSLELWG